MNSALMWGTGNNTTGTPLDFFARCASRFGGFVCDVAADQQLTLVPGCWFGPDHPDAARRDCLSIDWPIGWNWLNPPYGEPEEPCTRYKRAGARDGKTWLAGDYRCKKKRCKERGWHTDVYIPGCIDFVRKAEEQRQKGARTVALLAARTDVEWFHEYIWDVDGQRQRPGRHVEFLRGRLNFRRPGLPDDPAPFPSMLVVFRP